MATIKIKSGDTLSGIAKKNNTTVQNLLKLNPSISNPNAIRAGSSLNLSSGFIGPIQQKTSSSVKIPSFATSTPAPAFGPQKLIGPVQQKTTSSTTPKIPSFATPTPKQAFGPQKIIGPIQQKSSSGNTSNNTFSLGAKKASESQPIPFGPAQRQSGQSLESYAKDLGRQQLEFAAMNPFSVAPKTISQAQGKGLVAELGLGGTGFDGSFLGGLTKGNATKVAKQKVDQLQGQVSDKTSFALNQDFFNKSSQTQNALKGFDTAIKDSLDNPWSTKEEKQRSVETLVQDVTTQLSGNFDSVDQFDTLMKGNSKFAKLMQAFEKKGGDIDAIKAGINSQSLSPVDSEAQTAANPIEDTVRNSITADVPNIEGGTGESSDLLSGVREQSNKEIARLAGVPEQFADLYFGDQGIVTQQISQADQAIKDLTSQFDRIEKNTQSEFEASVRLAELQTEKDLLAIEENRKSTNNYLMGRLAKLGALNTTGEAPQALANIEAKYDQMASETKNNLVTAKADLANEKASLIADIQTQKANGQQTIQNNLNLTTSEMRRAMFDLDQDIQQQISGVIQGYNQQAADLDSQFLMEARKQAFESAKLKAKAASGASSRIINDLTVEGLSPIAKSVYQNPSLYSTLTPTDRADILPELMAVGFDTQTLTFKNPTTAQAASSAYAQRMIDSEDVFDRTENIVPQMSWQKFSRMQWADKPEEDDGFLKRMQKNAVLAGFNQSEREQFQAQRNFIQATLRKESGAAISNSEFANGSAQYFPAPNDGPSVLAQKKQNRQRAVQQSLAEAGNTFNTFQNVGLPETFGGGNEQIGTQMQQSAMIGPTQQSDGFTSSSGRTYNLPN